MYLGESPAVDTFAKEFVARKRAARGTGESVEWQTCVPARPRAPRPRTCHVALPGDDEPTPIRLKDADTTP